jgi:hypothetical protein
MWLYSSPDVYRLLVADRGWPLPRFTAWLHQTLTDALLSRPSTTAPEADRRLAGFEDPGQWGTGESG